MEKLRETHRIYYIIECVIKNDTSSGEEITIEKVISRLRTKNYPDVSEDAVKHVMKSLGHFQYHEKMKVLEYITTEMCNLHKLRGSDFLKRPKSELVDGGGDALVTDYNYIILSGGSYSSIYCQIATGSSNLSLTPIEVSKILKALERLWIFTPSYEARMSVDLSIIERLVKSSDESHYLNRRVVDFNTDPTTGLCSIAISVAYLKQELPHLLSDEIIEKIV